MIRVERLLIQGFRGFLERRELPMSVGKRPISVCIFGDNGTGKSSIGDAVEFFFKEDGILARLQKKTTENNAGLTATKHVLAAERQIRTEVAFAFDDGRAIARTTNASGVAGALAAEIKSVTQSAPVPLIMRSYEMQTFVADVKGAMRYEILSRWVGLERLTRLQDALTSMERKTEKWAKPAASKEAQLQSLDKLTARGVRDWSPPTIAKWLNDKLAHARATQRIATLADLERLEAELTSSQQGENDRSGAARYAETAQTFASLNGDGSHVERLLLGIGNWSDASRELNAARDRLSSSELRPVWSSAREYLLAFDAAVCPVCARPLSGPHAREHVLAGLERSLATLTSLQSAERVLHNATSDLKRSSRSVETQLLRAEDLIRACADEELASAMVAVSALRGSLAELDAGSTRAEIVSGQIQQSARELVAAAIGSADHCTREAERLRSQFSIPYGELIATVRQLIAIRDGWNRADGEERALVEVAEQFKAVAEAIRADVRAHVKQVVSALEDDVRAIYGALRGNDEHIPVVDILVSEDKKSMKVAVSLFGIEGVPPSGYLSDSQLNSLGLALYLAAVRRFNDGFRFILLDDVMSSYDSSHRLALVHVFDQYLGEFQVIVTTHEQAFFAEMKTALGSSGNWRFMRLKPWLLETGVRIEAERSSAEDIERRLRDGEKPQVLAQLIMSDVEEWLAEVCSDRNTDVRLKIKKDRSPALPTMVNLWSSAQSAFDESHRQHASYKILRAHPILNWPRHASSAGQLQISPGDLQTFWKHFKTFREDYATGLTNPTP
jgi:DNA repair exonuclease SbcCD ATPase subunit